ncbi:hypothetical protein J3R30DRAFT_770783 [Lentinula aciculospora]|uniref:RRM domain-containing protein n=1 Tax=Lentinula aciculospora TaxID=153920 RepID=A0A9W9DJ95_9AGAR|nr:hypothetical protein J3R30DRAFT_770783 [Lentinula aciculospora]
MSVLQKHVLARSVVFKQLLPSLEVKQIISCFPHGRFHDISPRSKDTLAIKFLDSRSASRFTQKFLSLPRAPPLKDATIEYEASDPLPVEVLTKIGLRNASRVIRVTSNNAKKIPGNLIHDVKECGPIESFESDGKKAVIHFMSIDTAIKALDVLRTSEGYAGYAVYYGFDKKCDTPPSYPANSQTDLILTDLPKGTTTSELLRRIQSGLPDLKREIIRSVVFDEPGAKAFINFLEPSVAKIVFDSFDNAKTSTGGVSVSWSRPSPNPVSASLRMAISAGASRTLIVSHLKDVQQLRRVLKTAKKLGTVVSHPYNPSNNKTVSIEFADIFSTFRAIERIAKDMDSYPDFSNTFISFATSTDTVRPIKIICAKATSTPEPQKPQTEEKQATPAPETSSIVSDAS